MQKGLLWFMYNSTKKNMVSLNIGYAWFSFHSNIIIQYTFVLKKKSLESFTIRYSYSCMNCNLLIVSKKACLMHFPINGKLKCADTETPTVIIKLHVFEISVSEMLFPSWCDARKAISPFSLDHMFLH